MYIFQGKKCYYYVIKGVLFCPFYLPLWKSGDRKLPGDSRLRVIIGNKQILPLWWTLWLVFLSSSFPVGVLIVQSPRGNCPCWKKNFTSSRVIEAISSGFLIKPWSQSDRSNTKVLDIRICLLLFGVYRKKVSNSSFKGKTNFLIKSLWGSLKLDNN